MTEGPGAKDAPRPFTDEELAAIGAYLPELRRSVAGQRILYTSLVIGFVVGLAAHVKSCGGSMPYQEALRDKARGVSDQASSRPEEYMNPHTEPGGRNAEMIRLELASRPSFTSARAAVTPPLPVRTSIGLGAGMCRTTLATDMESAGAFAELWC
jgi:hypothetical protein